MVLFKIYEEGHAALFPVFLFLTPWSHHLAEKSGEPLKSLAAVFSNGSMAWYAEPEEQTRISKELLRRMLHEGLFEIVDRQTRFHLDRISATCARLGQSDFAAMDDVGLCHTFSGYCRDVVELNAWGMLVTLMEMGQSSVITEEAYRYFSGKANAIGQLERVSELLSILCTPTEATFLRDKRVGEIRAAQLAREKGLHAPEVTAAVDALHSDLAWVSYGYTGPALGWAHFESQVATLAARDDLDALLEDTLGESGRLEERQRQLESEFSFDEYGRRLFRLARTFMFQKELRKQVLYRSFHAVLPLRRRIARRAGISLVDTEWLLPDELSDALSGTLDVSILRQRRTGTMVVLPFETRVLLGADAASFVSRLSVVPAVEADVSELSGQCGYAAAPVEGVVRRVFTAHDLDSLEPGDVLVSPATSPVMVPAMKRAGAIVTDQGGLTCHAAIVCRELKKPCVIGTKRATAVLKDGDRVVVDSTRGLVRKL